MENKLDVEIMTANHRLEAKRKKRMEEEAAINAADLKENILIYILIAALYCVMGVAKWVVPVLAYGVCAVCVLAAVFYAGAYFRN